MENETLAFENNSRISLIYLKNCIVIGEGATADGDGQIVIGNKNSAELKIYPSGDIFLNGKPMGSDIKFSDELRKAFQTTFLFKTIIPETSLNNPPIGNMLLYAAFSVIPLDIEGSNIAITGWIPSESDKKYMSDDSFAKAVEEGNEKNAKVLFKNIFLNWDSCDCGDGFPCSHRNWVYQIYITNEEKKHTLEMEDSIINACNEGRQAMIPNNESTIYDFYRMCELVGIKLELSDYALSLLK